MRTNASRPRHKGGSVTNDITIVDDRADEVRRIGREAVRACQERRRRLLQHPDLAAMLTKRPLNYPRPELWTGYVPGPIVTWRENGAPVLNDSPRGRALLEIGKLLHEREAA